MANVTPPMYHIILLTLLICTEREALGMTSECRRYNQRPDGNGSLSFVREVVHAITALKGEFRLIQCKSFNFCHIQWYYNGIPVGSGTATNDVSLSNLVLADNNQTLEITSAKCDATGNYTCVVSNEQSVIRHEYALQVIDRAWQNDPLQLQSSSECEDHQVVPGGNASFVCRFYYMSRGSRPFIWKGWRKFNETLGYFVELSVLDYDYTIDIVKGMMSKCSSNGDSAYMLTTWLNITDVTEDKLGRYQAWCSIFTIHYRETNMTLTFVKPLGDVTDSAAIATTVCTLVALFILGLLSWQRYGIDVKLWYHEHISDGGKDAHNEDEKLYDAYIVSGCAGRDRCFVYDILCPSLQDNYNLYLRERDSLPGTVVCEEIINCLKMSRRCIIVLSSDFYHSSLSSSSSSKMPSLSSGPSSIACSRNAEDSTNWSMVELEYALDLMRTHRHHIIPVIYREFQPEAGFRGTDSKGNMIDYVMKNLNSLSWEQKSSSKIDEWALKRLRLRLHPPRSKSQSPWKSEMMSGFLAWYSPIPLITTSCLSLGLCSVAFAHAYHQFLDVI